MGRDIELAILFADVVGSTRLYERMGDLRARDIVAICIDVMRSATEQHQGTVIKTIGDEVMATFPSANLALTAGAQMQQQIARHSQLKVDGHPVSIRIGCHFGPVVLESRDVFGATVHTANRVTSQSKGGQIMITGTVVEQLDPDWRTQVRQVDVATLKGQGGETILYEVLWQTEDVTSVIPQVVLQRMGGTAVRLRLSAWDGELVLDEDRPWVVVGRAEDNDLVIKGNLVSRMHARIEFTRQRFMLVDMSTNGTFVRPEGGEESFVRRDSVQLKGKGLIGLGKQPEPDSPLAIRYACEEE